MGLRSKSMNANPMLLSRSFIRFLIATASENEGEKSSANWESIDSPLSEKIQQSAILPGNFILNLFSASVYRLQRSSVSSTTDRSFSRACFVR